MIAKITRLAKGGVFALNNSLRKKIQITMAIGNATTLDVRCSLDTMLDKLQTKARRGKHFV